MTAFANPNYAAAYNPNYGAPLPGQRQAGSGLGGQGFGASGAAFPALSPALPSQSIGWGGGFVAPQGGVVAGLMALANLRNHMLEGQPRMLLLMSCRAGRTGKRRAVIMAGPAAPAAPPPYAGRPPAETTDPVSTIH